MSNLFLFFFSNSPTLQRRLPQTPAGPVRPPGGALHRPDGVVHRPVHPQRLRAGDLAVCQVRVRQFLTCDVNFSPSLHVCWLDWDEHSQTILFSCGCVADRNTHCCCHCFFSFFQFPLSAHDRSRYWRWPGRSLTNNLANVPLPKVPSLPLTLPAMPSFSAPAWMGPLCDNTYVWGVTGLD